MLNLSKDGECWYWFILQNFSVSSRRISRGGHIFSKLKKVPQFWRKKMPWLWPSMGYISNAVLKVYRRKKKTKVDPARPFFHALLIKCLSKCPNFKKTPLLWKIPGYLILKVLYGEESLRSIFHSLCKESSFLSTTQFIYHLFYLKRFYHAAYASLSF